MKRMYDSSSLKKLSDQDTDTCLLLIYPDVPPIKVKFSMQIWPSENATFYIVIHHLQVALKPSSWLSAYSSLSDNDPEPVSRIVVWKTCQFVKSTGYATEMNCTCTFPCNIMVEMSFMFQSEVDVCEIRMSLSPADG